MTISLVLAYVNPAGIIVFLRPTVNEHPKNKTRSQLL